MTLQFDKIGQTPRTFRETYEGVVLEGSLYKSGYHRVRLESRLTGTLPVVCDRCGTAFDTPVDTQLALTLSDQCVEAKDDLDIIEFLDGKVDLAFIAESEVTAIKSEYHYCDDCLGNEETFEMEF
jgi:uncharacterized metal-binding protein YceD (DUF177 family)